MYSTFSTISPWIAFFIAITFHEFSHALTAYWLGDNTAKDAGRLTLNPLVHIDPIGFICLLLFRIGWAKPVPMNQANFRYPKLYAIICALAGPLSNFILALVCLYALKYIYTPFALMSAGPILFVLLQSCVYMNVMLGVFNLLPIPPLDGGHIINALIPDKWLPNYYRLMPLFLIGLLILLAFPANQLFLARSMETALFKLEKLVI